MEERRQKRASLVYTLRVFDAEDDRLVGHLIDVNTKGIKLASDGPLPVGRLYRLRLRLPFHAAERDEDMIVSAESIWSRRDRKSEFFNTGFVFSSIEKPSVAMIRQMIKRFRYRPSKGPDVLLGGSAEG